VRCPTLEGQLAHYDARNALRVPGVQAVFEIPSAVAVVARNTFAALSARELLRLDWKPGLLAGLSWEEIRGRLARAATGKGKVQREESTIAHALKKAHRICESAYETPYLAHGCMEPMNCTARVTEEECDIWVGTQAQTAVQRAGARITGLSASRVRVHTQLLGGGFSRRGDTDFVEEAVHIARVVEGPVQLSLDAPGRHPS
jgi:isoquinoline 1-oxidoreductase beta subunit